MKICPKCGYSDHIMWRPNKNRPLCNYVMVDTLEWNDPKLLKKIREVNPNPYFDGVFMYHITKKGYYVERIEKILYDYMSWGIEPQEKVEH